MTLNHARLPIPPSRRTRKNHGIRLPPDCQGKRRARRKPRPAPQGLQGQASREGIRGHGARPETAAQKPPTGFLGPHPSLFPHGQENEAAGGDAGSTSQKAAVLPPTVKPSPRKDGAGAANPTAGSGVAWGPGMRVVRALGRDTSPAHSLARWRFPGGADRPERNAGSAQTRFRPRTARTNPLSLPPVAPPQTPRQGRFVAARRRPQPFPPNASLWYAVSAPLGDLS